MAALITRGGALWQGTITGIVRLGGDGLVGTEPERPDLSRFNPTSRLFRQPGDYRR